MKKILSIAVIFTIVFSTFSMLAPQIKAEGNPLEVDPFNYQGTYVINTTELNSREKTALSFVQKYAIKYAISPALIMAIIKQESNFNPNAIGDGGLAIGYMQLHWDAAYDAGYRSARGDSKEYAKEDWPTDGLDPDTNIKYGCGYLKICYDKHKDSPVYSDPLKNTISAYNLGWPHGPDKSNENNYVNPVFEYYEDYKDKYYSGVEPDWPAGKANICRHPWDGFTGFEEGTEEAVISSTIPGMEFTTTYGIDWRYGDIRTGKYNVRSDLLETGGAYTCNGYFFAWLGVTGDTGRIDFPKGTATYLSVLVSTYSGVKLDAYNADGNFLATSGWAENNLWTRTFTRLTVEAPGMSYVIVHDTGNYWLIDDLCTDAPGAPPPHYKADELAREVIGAPYLDGGKGWNWNPDGGWKWEEGRFLEPEEIKEKEYYYYSEGKIEKGMGLDCSGLIYWSYNKAYYKISGKKEKYTDRNPLNWREEGAEGQWRRVCDPIEKDKLKAGDLLFFNTPASGNPDHVAMYVGGPFELKYGEDKTFTYNTVESTAWGDSIITVAFYDVSKGTITTLQPSTGKTRDLHVDYYGRLTKVMMRIVSQSPVDLVVTDPEGITITKDVSEADGMYYREYDIDGDGQLDDIVTMTKRKIGDYLITVVPEPDALPGDTYSLEITGEDVETIVLAEDVRISDIPTQPYIIRSTETEIIQADTTPPITTMSIGSPQYTDPAGNLYVTSDTPFTLTAVDNNGAGSGVANTAYKIYNATYDTGWIVSVPPLTFQITGLDDGTYFIDYNGTDNAGNVEPTKTQAVILDNTPPVITETNFENVALQDGVTLEVSAWELSEVASVTFSIQCAQGNIISPEFESMPATLSPEDKWKLSFDTTQLPDGFYLAIVNGTDVLGNTGITTVPFSIRNWACVELLPASESNKAGRTMPVKFSLRVVATVDSGQPFVRNEELTILIFETGHPDNVLQTSTYGSTARDYRIDGLDELYITNFRTLKKQPKSYTVEIYRKGFLIGTFTFSTVK